MNYNSYYRKLSSLWVERLERFRCRRHGEARAKEAKAARCPKTRPPLKRAPTPTVRAPKCTIKL